jgi:hypothetical protein
MTDDSNRHGRGRGTVQQFKTQTDHYVVLEEMLGQQ